MRRAAARAAAALCLAAAALARAETEPPGLDVRVVAEVSSSRAYVGERVTLTYSLVRGRDAAGPAGAESPGPAAGEGPGDSGEVGPPATPGPGAPGPAGAGAPAPLLTPVREVRLVEAPRFPSFWANEVELDGSGREAPDVEHGGAHVTPLRRFHLYPITSGRARIEPPTYSMLAYPAALGRVEALPVRITRRAEVVTVEAVPLPEAGRPATFAGAVGRFSVSASLEGREAVAGDVVRVAVEISGDGNLEATGPPRLPPVDGLRVSSPRRMTVDLGLADADGVGRAVWHVDAVAERQGRFALGPVELDYFDPATARYEVARSAPLEVAVAARAVATGGPPPPSRAPGGSWWWALAVAAVTAIGAAAVLAARRSIRPARPAGAALRDGERAAASRPAATDARGDVSATELARLRVRLKRALVLAEDARARGDDRGAHAHLLAGLRDAARTRFGVAPEALPRDRFAEALELHARCSEAAYAPETRPIDRAGVEAAARVFHDLTASSGEPH